MIVNTKQDEMDFSRYVNRETSINLDSSDAFEGPEKLLEIWFAPSASSLPFGMSENGLRDIPRKQWEKVLDQVQCKVLSVVSTSELDSYVLSESSLFVFRHRAILKTCGTTTLITGIPLMLKIIEEFAGYPQTKQPWRIFYSRKSFLFPDRQKHPHRSWKAEVNSLDGMFANGRAYVVGDIMTDHWYLYTTLPTKSILDFPNPERNVAFGDENLEIMMTDLCPCSKHCGQFFTDRLPGESQLHHHCSDLGAPADDEDPGHTLGNALTKLAGIDEIYPTKKQIIDSFCFTPCGYSCNGLVSEDDYFTIHVTPEEHCSYASFETTVKPQQFGLSSLDIIQKVSKIFKPGKFSVVYFQSQHAKENDSSLSAGFPSGFKRTNKITYDLVDYSLIFMTFESVNH